MSQIPARRTSAGDRKPDGPRRIRGGVKLRGRSEPQQPVAVGILAALSRTVSPEELIEGEAYARQGQAASFEVRSGGVWAKVQGRAARPYQVRITIDPFDEETWGFIIEALATEAGVMVKLLAGEMPERMDDHLARLGLTLLPAVDAPLAATCTCVRGGGCKHVAVAGLLLAEALERDPLTAFRVRGMPADRLLEQVRQARMLENRGVAAAHFDPHIPESHVPVAPLVAPYDGFWRPPAPLAGMEAEETPVPHAVHHALLRRLGPSPLGGRFPLVGLLASIYDEVSEEIRAQQGAVDEVAENDADADVDEG